MDISLKSYRTLSLIIRIMCVLLFSLSQSANAFYVEYTRKTAQDPVEWVVNLDDYPELASQPQAIRVSVLAAGGGAGGNISYQNQIILGGNGGHGARLDFAFPLTATNKRVKVNMGLPGQAGTDLRAGGGGLGVSPGGSGGGPGSSLGGSSGGGGGGGGATIGFSGVDGGSANRFLAGIVAASVTYSTGATPLPFPSYSGGGTGGGGGGIILVNVAPPPGITNVRSPGQSFAGGTAIDVFPNARFSQDRYKETYLFFSPHGGGQGGKADSLVQEQRNGEPAKIVLTNKNMVYGRLFRDDARTGVYTPSSPYMYTVSGSGFFIYKATGVGTASAFCDTSQFIISGSALSSAFGVPGFYGIGRLDENGEEILKTGEYCLYTKPSALTPPSRDVYIPTYEDFRDSFYGLLNSNYDPILPPTVYNLTNASPDYVYYFKIDNDGYLVPREGVNIGLGPLIIPSKPLIKGRVYDDLNYNGSFDVNEPVPDGLNLYVKLVLLAADAKCSAAVTATRAVMLAYDGTYQFDNLDAGRYCIILSDNNTLNNLTPFQSSKWWYTQNKGGVIDNLLVQNNTLENNNFGLTETPLLLVSGRLYDDKNSDAVWNETDGITNFNLYVKLINTRAQCNSASFGRQVAVSPLAADGTYLFSNVTPGNYCLILSDNADNTDLTPYKPASGWWYTQNRTGMIRIVMTVLDSVENNFGLTQSLILRGNVFIDNGIGAGIAYDGLKEESEAGVQQARIELFSSGSTPELLNSVNTNVSGDYEILISNSAWPTNLEVRVVPTLGTASVSQCLSRIPNSSTTPFCSTAPIPNYSRFAIILNDVDVRDRYLFGLAKTPTFESDQYKYAKNGAYVNFFQSVTSYIEGYLTFNYTRQSEQVLNFVINPLIYLDNNCNGELDKEDTLIRPRISFKLNERKCFITQFMIPSNYPVGENNIVGNLVANFSYGSTTINSSHPIGLTIILGDNQQGISLFKQVDKPTAKPGELLTYTIEYQNHNQTPISNLVIRDKLADYTDLVTDSAKCDVAEQPSGVTCHIESLISPDNGEREIIWRFNQPIPAFARGVVRYQLKLQL